MLQEGYMLQTASFANAQHKIRKSIVDLIGEESTQEFYEAWWENHVTKEDIDSLKSWGFNSVRLPMHYNLFTLPIEEEPVPGVHTWLERGFAMTDELLSWCADNEMYLILDLHATPGGQGKDEGISDYDTTKPSLWESQANRDKTVALWARLAERYKDEPWIGGYDLINETNWPLDNNALLKEIYLKLTDAIRAVDQKHIIFIEGNWFANDFTNLTPPWDDNLVYSPHKYWSINDRASIQWVIDIRNRFNVPIYFGECGENSNLWFRDAIKLFEDNNMGWAWWPMKKIESIAGPLTVIKTEGYDALLDYWNNGGTPPSAEEAKATLLQVTELLKMENCVYQYDVIDAMFRQVEQTGTLPFVKHKVPGIIYASDFDLGPEGEAYHDTENANYQVSTGVFTAWNNGWTYRNDGVDIEKTSDAVNSNGYNVGWTLSDEWMKYSAEIESGLYDVRVRVATERDGGRFHFRVGDAPVSRVADVTSTGGWQTWTTKTLSDVILFDQEDHIRFYIDREEFNVGSFEFVKRGETTAVPTQYLSARTSDDRTIRVHINKPMDARATLSASDFEMIVDGVAYVPDEVTMDPNHPRVLIFKLPITLTALSDIRVSYSGSSITGIDGTKLESFDQGLVQNNLAIVHGIPGRIEAEEFFTQVGIQLEATTDAGGGQNIGFLDRGDYLDYFIDVAQAGTYLVDYRTAAESEKGAVKLSLVEDGIVTDLDVQSFESTGGWQTWRTTSSEVRLPQGKHQLRITITEPLFNINWLDFSIITSSSDQSLSTFISMSPNPGEGMYDITTSDLPDDVYMMDVLDMAGQLISHNLYPSVRDLPASLDLRDQPDGAYLIRIQGRSGSTWQERLVKLSK